MFVVLGGDGSIIEAISYLVNNDILHVKLLGVNTGHLGFISNNISVDDVSRILSDAEDDSVMDSICSKRRLIEVASKLSSFYGINEVSVHPISLGRLFTVDVLINDVPITYQGDGLLISTTSGSTAYNLSAGGPIISPDVSAICLTPLNPFSLASRPLVLNTRTIIEIRTSGNNYTNINVDGKPTGYGNAKIAMSSKTVDIIKLNSFMTDIQEKLGWNANIKN